MLVGKADVLVIVPVYIAGKHDKFPRGHVPPKYYAVNNVTSPTDGTAISPTTNVKIGWYHILKIQVWDQFHQNLDRIYEGAEVDEQISEKWQNIHSPILAKGIYNDPLGYLAQDAVAIFQTKELAEAYIAKYHAPPAPLQPTNPVQLDIPIKVDGNILAHGIVNRSIATDIPDFIEILWPDDNP